MNDVLRGGDVLLNVMLIVGYGRFHVGWQKNYGISLHLRTPLVVIDTNMPARCYICQVLLHKKQCRMLLTAVQ